MCVAAKVVSEMLKTPLPARASVEPSPWVTVFEAIVLLVIVIVPLRLKIAPPRP